MEVLIALVVVVMVIVIPVTKCYEDKARNEAKYQCVKETGGNVDKCIELFGKGK